MDVITTGTGNPIPDPARAGPSTLVRTPAGPLLFDCGRAVLMRCAAIGVLPIQLRALLVTHLHSDHLTDLNDVITTRWVMTQEPQPLQIYGPVGTAAVVAAILDSLEPDIGYRIAHHDDLDWPAPVEVHEIAAEPGASVLEDNGVRVSAEPTDHRPVAPSIGYRIEFGGAAVAIAGDTVPCDGLDALCRDADVYVQTVVREDFVKLVPSARFQDILDYHSSIEQAAETAARNNVRTLVLTHLVPGAPAAQAPEWAAIAAALFDGEIVVAEDLTTVSC